MTFIFFTGQSTLNLILYDSTYNFKVYYVCSVGAIKKNEIKFLLIRILINGLLQPQNLMRE